jgi:hypothetical protein
LVWKTCQGQALCLLALSTNIRLSLEGLPGSGTLAPGLDLKNETRFERPARVKHSSSCPYLQTLDQVQKVCQDHALLLLSLSTNSRPGLKGLPGSNTLAPVLIHKQKTRFERSARVKHSSSCPYLQTLDEVWMVCQGQAL